MSRTNKNGKYMKEMRGKEKIRNCKTEKARIERKEKIKNKGNTHKLHFKKFTHNSTELKIEN